MTTQLEAAARQALEALLKVKDMAWSEDSQEGRELISSLRSALEQQAAQEPLSEREIELLDGMIDVQLDHAQRCDSIPNRPMAEKQKGWDLERVALLRKIKTAMLTVVPQQAAQGHQPLTEEQLRDTLRSCPHDTVENLRVRWLYAKDFARAIEAAHGIGDDK